MCQYEEYIACLGMKINFLCPKVTNYIAVKCKWTYSKLFYVMLTFRNP